MLGRLRSNFYQVNEILEGKVSIYLDLIRGIAAILVVLEHLGSRLFVGYGNAENQGLLLVKLLYLFNLVGGPAVIIFFVISGLFISRSVLNAIFSQNWTWKTYLINRFSRLYTVLIPALFLTFLLDRLGFYFFGAPIKNSTVTDFVGNLFFLQKIFVNQYGSNGPLWSLSYEFWYYMLFPLILLLFVKANNMLKLTYLLLIILIFFMVGSHIISYFFIWLIGTSILVLPTIHLLKRKLILPITLTLAIFSVLLRPLVGTGRLLGTVRTSDLFFVDVITGVSFGILVISLMHITAHETVTGNLTSLFAKMSKMLASFSFSLYLIHNPIITFVYYWSVKYGFNGLQPSLQSVLLEVLLVILICVIAFLFAKVTEARTNKVRVFMNNMIEAYKRKPNFLIKQKVFKNRT